MLLSSSNQQKCITTFDFKGKKYMKNQEKYIVWINELQLRIDGTL